ncbi:hypothetical protein HJFPF1_09099 [Paramyrothecium foliicola]|nr:hypothetical protein HJFPF1_09099 [Paramyrothecium foliicola]
MGRFGLPIPGRKKAHPPPITVTEPMTKAHKILGSVPLNIDSSKGWNGQAITSSDKIEGAESRSHTGSIRPPRTLGMASPASVAEPWADESDILPSSFKISATGGDDAFTETSTVLRSKQSSSTLKSWYDKSKMPLSVSQQTSASAMAKGLPPKAQKMLDMDNMHALPKSKKPSKLDLSGLLSNALSPKQHHDQVLGADYSTRSPSILSPPLSSGRRRRMMGKHSPKGNMNSPAGETGRPSTSGGATSRGKNPHLNGLPDLYEHYEQMSFRQVMDAELEQDDEPITSPKSGLGIVPTTESTSLPSQSMLSITPAQTLLQPPAHRSSLALLKANQQLTPSEDSGSVSSRHTKTSRASVVAQSFQDSDLQETSVLMLSSDSEEDYDEPETKSQKSTLTRPISRIPETMALLEQGLIGSSPAPNSTEKRMSKSSKSSKRTSFAPSVTYLGVPGAQPSSLPTPDYQTTFGVSTSASASSARCSIVSSSSISSAPSWQTRSDQGSPDAFVVAMLPSQEKADEHNGIGRERDESSRDLQRDTLLPHTDQPTPPLSPTSVDFYIRSAHSSVDGSSGHNRFMAVTRQEEMLLSALRHKRQTMRESRLGSQQPPEEQEPAQKHLSKASDVTVTNLLDFDFPAPPSSNDSTPRIPQSGSEKGKIDDRRCTSNPLGRPDHDENDTTSPILSPAPIYPRQSQIFLKNSTYQPPATEKQPYASDAYALSQEVLNAEDLDDLIGGIARSGNSRSPPRSRRISRASSSSSSVKSLWQERRAPKLAVASSMDPVMESEDYTPAGIPRPDSPISPSVFPMPPTMAPLNKRMARLSAVGGGRLGNAPDWWKHDDN